MLEQECKKCPKTEKTNKQIFEDFCNEYNITCFDFKKIGRDEYASEKTNSAFIIFKYSNFRS